MNTTNNQAVRGPLEPTVRPLAERLREFAADDDDYTRSDGTQGTTARAQAMREAADELGRLNGLVELLEAWQREGEAMLNKNNISAAFALGRWWADRPWRERPNV